MKVMVVDDEQDVKPLFEQRFRREIRAREVEFIFAFSAEDALEILKQSNAADVMLILSDINMPGMTGLELLKMVKEQFPYLKVMMITAYGDVETRDRALGYGAADFLTKPLDFTELKRTILGHV